MASTHSCEYGLNLVAEAGGHRVLVMDLAHEAAKTDHLPAWQAGHNVIRFCLE
jgi:hypothetical protein